VEEPVRARIAWVEGGLGAEAFKARDEEGTGLVESGAAGACREVDVSSQIVEEVWGALGDSSGEAGLDGRERGHGKVLGRRNERVERSWSCG
jgi:hypothetical protein